MKTKLTITIEEDLVPKAKEFARTQGHSLSKMIENSLRKMTTQETQRFSEKWRGKFKPSEKDSPRYKTLAKRFL